MIGAIIVYMDTLSTLIGTAVISLTMSADPEPHCSVGAALRLPRGTCTWPHSYRSSPTLVFHRELVDVPQRAVETVVASMDAWQRVVRIAWSSDAREQISVHWVGGIYRQGYIALAGLPCAEMRGIIWISSEAYLDWDLDMLRVIVTHEMGHILGLSHSRDPESVMYSTPSRRAVIMPADRQRLASFYAPSGAVLRRAGAMH